MFRRCQSKLPQLSRKQRLVFSAIICVIVYLIFPRNPLQNESFLELDKCPACYGTDFCPSLQSGNFKITRKYVWDFHLINVKNVFFAKGESEEIVLKKLGHNWELKALDKKICAAVNEDSQYCDVKLSISQHDAVKSNNYRIPVSALFELSDMMRCPSQRLVDRMMDKYNHQDLNMSRAFLSQTDKMHIVTTLMVNSEPLLMQTFPKQDGWPFPRYLGACGRFVAMESVKDSLAKYYDSPWDFRIDLAYQIFQIADQLTNNELGFALYLLDLSYDNLGVDTDGRVLILDMENILVVDLAKVKREKPVDWDKPLTSEFDECPHYGTCLSFSSDSLCSRYHADHNYYTVCRNLLSSYGSDHGKPGGLLHHMPAFARDKFNLHHLLNECAKPSKPNGRFMIKDKLLFTLNELRKVDW